MSWQHRESQTVKVGQRATSWFPNKITVQFTVFLANIANFRCRNLFCSLINQNQWKINDILTFKIWKISRGKIFISKFLTLLGLICKIFLIKMRTKILVWSFKTGLTPPGSTSIAKVAKVRNFKEKLQS